MYLQECCSKRIILGDIIIKFDNKLKSGKYKNNNSSDFILMYGALRWKRGVSQWEKEFSKI